MKDLDRRKSFSESAKKIQELESRAEVIQYESSTISPIMQKINNSKFIYKKSPTIQNVNSKIKQYIQNSNSKTSGRMDSSFKMRILHGSKISLQRNDPKMTSKEISLREGEEHPRKSSPYPAKKNFTFENFNTLLSKVTKSGVTSFKDSGNRLTPDRATQDSWHTHCATYHEEEKAVTRQENKFSIPMPNLTNYRKASLTSKNSSVNQSIDLIRSIKPTQQGSVAKQQKSMTPAKGKSVAIRNNIEKSLNRSLVFS